jgi:hypothetical protein
MILEVIEYLPEWFLGGGVLVDVSFVALLPFEGQTDIFTVSTLFPLITSRHDLSDEMVVVSRPNIVFHGFRHDWYDFGNFMAFWNCTRSFDWFFLTVYIALSIVYNTFFIRAQPLDNKINFQFSNQKDNKSQ